jgi:Recombination endonuclease VII
VAWKKNATHCPNGHELTPENVGTDSSGSPKCLLCDRASHKRYRAKSKEYFKEYGKRRRRDHPQYEKKRHREYHARPYVKAGYRARRLRRYGLSQEQFEDLERAHGGRCAICLIRPKKNLCVDHDHKCCPWTTNEGELCGRCIRGLLCTRCNSGFFGEDPVILRRAAAYFEAWDKIWEVRQRQPKPPPTQANLHFAFTQEVPVIHDNQGTTPTLASCYQ